MVTYFDGVYTCILPVECNGDPLEEITIAILKIDGLVDPITYIFREKYTTFPSPIQLYNFLIEYLEEPHREFEIHELKSGEAHWIP